MIHIVHDRFVIGLSLVSSGKVSLEGAEDYSILRSSNNGRRSISNVSYELVINENCQQEFKSAIVQKLYSMS